MSAVATDYQDSAKYDSRNRVIFRYQNLLEVAQVNFLPPI